MHAPVSDCDPLALAGTTSSFHGALRNTFEAVPDVPASSFHLELFGGHRGLIELSRDLCAHSYRATAKLDGQNGKLFDTTPKIRTSCKHKRHGKHRRGGRH